jgi:hypothetical protein
MRQKHATDAKLLATQNRQREGIRKEQDKIRAAEAAEKQANAERLKKSLPPGNTSTKDTLPDPSQTPKVDLDILPKAEQTTEKVTTPEERVAKASLDFTLSEEGEGDNLSGNKQLQDEAEHEDESSSKMPKVSLNPVATE